MSGRELVRSWKDPDSRSGDPVAHPAGDIALDIFGGQAAQANSLSEWFSCNPACEATYFDGTCNAFSIGCCPAEQ